MESLKGGRGALLFITSPFQPQGFRAIGSGPLLEAELTCTGLSPSTCPRNVNNTITLKLYCSRTRQVPASGQPTGPGPVPFLLRPQQRWAPPISQERRMRIRALASLVCGRAEQGGGASRVTFWSSNHWFPNCCPLESPALFEIGEFPALTPRHSDYIALS